MKSSVFMLQVLNKASKPRLLPILIALSCLVLTVRVNVLWQHLSTTSSLSASQAIIEVGQAATASSENSSKDSPPAPAPTPEAPKQNTLAESATSKQTEVSQSSSTQESGETKITFDPLLMTEHDVNVLMDLAKRRTELEDREKKIQNKETIIQAAHKELEEKNKELAILKGDLQKLLGTIDSKTKENIKQLVGVYERMKPKDAAKFFNKLDMDVLMELIQAMDGKKSSAILAAMDVDKVKTLTMNLADAQKVLESRKKE